MLEMNEIYCMDCMDGMKDIPDSFFDVAIVDPPYGIGTITYMPCNRLAGVGGFIDRYEVTAAVLSRDQRSFVGLDICHAENTKTTVNVFGDFNVSPPPQYFSELFRVSKNQIIWGGNYFLLLPTRGFVVWSKPTVSVNFSMAMCEYAWTSYNCNSKLVSCPPMQKAGQRVHPTQKPVKVYDFLFEAFRIKGRVLDTHVGSGTCIISARNHNCEYMGFEIEPQYYELARKRVAESNKFLTGSLQGQAKYPSSSHRTKSP